MAIELDAEEELFVVRACQEAFKHAVQLVTTSATSVAAIWSACHVLSFLSLVLFNTSSECVWSYRSQQILVRVSPLTPCCRESSTEPEMRGRLKRTIVCAHRSVSFRALWLTRAALLRQLLSWDRKGTNNGSDNYTIHHHPINEGVCLLPIPFQHTSLPSFRISKTY